MPSCRHTPCDSIGCPVNCGNVPCDGCDGTAGCRHNRPRRASAPRKSRRPRGAVTPTTAGNSEISAVSVRLPATPLVLIPRSARALLAILVELTEVPVLEEVRHDR